MNKPSTFVSKPKESARESWKTEERGKIILQHTTTLLCTLLNVFLKSLVELSKEAVIGAAAVVAAVVDTYSYIVENSQEGQLNLNV